jgi:hypothetical protein
MEVACRAFFPPAAAVPAELQALRDASPERRTGRRVSVAAIFLKRRVQFSNRHYSRHTSVSASRPRHLKILGLDKHLRTTDKFANEFLNFSSCSFSCSTSQDYRVVQHHNPVIYAGVAATGPGMADESKEADLASALQRIVVSAKDIGLSEGTRTVTIKVCGVTSDYDLQRYGLSTMSSVLILSSVFLVSKHVTNCTALCCTLL